MAGTYTQARAAPDLATAICEIPLSRSETDSRRGAQADHDVILHHQEEIMGQNFGTKHLNDLYFVQGACHARHRGVGVQSCKGVPAVNHPKTMRRHPA